MKSTILRRTGSAVAVAALLVASPALAQVYPVYSDYDGDASSGLDYAEFGRYSERAFERYDMDGDDHLSTDEFARFEQDYGPLPAGTAEAWDTVADRRISATEFDAGLFALHDGDSDQLVSETEYGLYGSAGFDQVGGLDNTVQSNEIVTMADWRYDELYTDGISVEDLIDAKSVWGIGGGEIGEVENVIFGSNGQVVALVAQVGGFWDIGDTHVSVPWDMVEVGRDYVSIPVTEDTVGDYSVFVEDYLTATDARSDIQEVEGDGFGEIVTGPNAWPATDLIGDYARLRDGDTYRNYGYINDVIIRDGEIAATVVSPDAGWGTTGGYYAYPYTG